ncbi:MAG: DUF58 domain-containing protein [Actinomycetota bacterium]|nr:DUF58 domain-containing protein [Actinomycetota bacterium]
MLTRRGWALIAGSVLMAVAGRLLGVVELYVLAAGGAVLVVSGVVLVVTRSFDLDASRHLYPPRVHAGDDSRVELVIRNRGRSRTPVLALQDALGGGPRRARFLLPPLGPGQEDRASYRLPTERRGVFSIGPLEASVTDPFGVATRAGDVAPVAELVVYPHVDAVVPLSHTAGGDQMATSSHPSAVGPSGYDFYALRGYQVGDDLRRVHWPSTARRDELMIRQQELPWQGRATVVLDTRRRFHTDASFESAVSAAASILTACWRDGSAVRLLSTDGTDSGFGTGEAHLEGLLSCLAFVGPGPADHVERLASTPPPGGSVAVVATADVPVEDIGLLGRLAGRSGGLITVVVDGTRGRPPVVGGTVVRVTATSGFPDAWNAAVGAVTLRQGAHR